MRIALGEDDDFAGFDLVASPPMMLAKHRPSVTT